MAIQTRQAATVAVSGQTDDLTEVVDNRLMTDAEQAKLANVPADTNAALAGKADDAATTAALALKADLVGGTVPSGQLPSFVDDILEAANFAALPGTGETGKIYITLDDNKQYRWSGSGYVDITGSGGGGQTVDVQAALDGAANPGAGNVFATIADRFKTYVGAVPPTTTDNLAAGYKVGSSGIDTATGICYKLVAAPGDVAQWDIDLTSGTGPTVGTGNVNDTPLADPASGEFKERVSSTGIIVTRVNGAPERIYTPGPIKTHTSQLIGAALDYVDVPITSNDMVIKGFFALPTETSANLGIRTVAFQIGNGTTVQTDYIYRTEGNQGVNNRTGLSSTDATMVLMGNTLCDDIVPCNMHLRILDALDNTKKTSFVVQSDGNYWRNTAGDFTHIGKGSGQANGTAQVDDFIRFRGQIANGDLTGEFDTWDL